MQEACRRTCQRKTAKQAWFENDLKRLRTETKRTRRNWQWNKTDANRLPYIERRNNYNKEIKRKK